MKRGKTPVLIGEQARLLLYAIDVSKIAGLRDRAITGVMVYSFARVGAVRAMNIEDFDQSGKRWWMRLHEEDGKQHEIPSHHNAGPYFDAYTASSSPSSMSSRPKRVNHTPMDITKVMFIGRLTGNLRALRPPTTNTLRRSRSPRIASGGRRRPRKAGRERRFTPYSAFRSSMRSRFLPQARKSNLKPLSVVFGNEESLLIFLLAIVLYNYMKTHMERSQAMAAVKVGISRQIAIPKKLHDQLGLTAGDYLEIVVRGGKLILTPKQFIDKRLDEAEGDVHRGRVVGPFNTAKQAMKALRTRPR